MYGWYILGKTWGHMNKEKTTQQDQEAIKQWLEKNEVTKCEPFTKTDPEDIVYTFKAGTRGRKPKGKSND